MPETQTKPKGVVPSAPLAEVKRIEIFRSGEYEFEQPDGAKVRKDFTPDIVQGLVRNFNELNVQRKLWPVPAVFGHAPKERQAVLKMMGLPAAARHRLLWTEQNRDGGLSVWASFADMPESVASLYNAKAYPTRSVEIKDDFVHEGKHYGPTLMRTALLGNEVPRVKGMSEGPPATYQDEPPTFTLFADQPSVLLFFEVPAMSRQEILDQLKAAGADVSAITDQVPDAILAAWLASLQAASSANGGGAQMSDNPAMTHEQLVAELLALGKTDEELKDKSDEELLAMFKQAKPQAGANPPANNPSPAPTPGVQPPAPQPKQIITKFSETPEYTEIMGKLTKLESGQKRQDDAAKSEREQDVLCFVDEMQLAGKISARDVDPKNPLCLTKQLKQLSDVDYTTMKREIRDREAVYNFTESVPAGGKAAADRAHEEVMQMTPARRAVAAKLAKARGK